MSLQNEQTIKACTCLKYYDERKLSISENHLALAKYTLVHIIYNDACIILLPAMQMQLESW